MYFAKYVFTAPVHMLGAIDLYMAHTLPIYTPCMYAICGIHMKGDVHNDFWLRKRYHFINGLQRRGPKKLSIDNHLSNIVV